MLSTLLVIGAVLVGLLVLLAVIVGLSARPTGAAKGQAGARRTPSWVVDAGRPHPDAWSPVSTSTVSTSTASTSTASTSTNEMPAIR